MAAPALTLPPMAPGIGCPQSVSVHLCWARVEAHWLSKGSTLCGVKVDPDSVGLCDDHLTEFRRLTPGRE